MMKKSETSSLQAPVVGRTGGRWIAVVYIDLTRERDIYVYTFNTWIRRGGTKRRHGPRSSDTFGQHGNERIYIYSYKSSTALVMYTQTTQHNYSLVCVCVRKKKGRPVHSSSYIFKNVWYARGVYAQLLRSVRLLYTHTHTYVCGCNIHVTYVIYTQIYIQKRMRTKYCQQVFACG